MERTTPMPAAFSIVKSLPLPINDGFDASYTTSTQSNPTNLINS